MAFITWDSKSAHTAKWAVIGFVVVVLILIAVAYLVKNNSPANQDARKLSYSDVSLTEFTKQFENECPSITECKMEAISSFLIMYYSNGLSTEQIPRISEMKSRVSLELANQRSNLVTVNNFWSNHDTITAATYLGMLSTEDIASWTKYLVSFDSAEFCPRLFDMGLTKDITWMSELDKEGYGYFCHVKWADTIYYLIVEITKAAGTIEYFSSEPDFTAIKARLCMDISAYSEKDYFNYLYGFGYAYVRMHRFCNVPLLDREVTKLKQIVDAGPRTDPEEESFRLRYLRYV